MYLLHTINSDSQTRLLNVLGQITLYRVIHKSLRDFWPLRYSNAPSGEPYKYATAPSTQKKKKHGDILYLLMCSFLLCLSLLLRSRVRNFRRDLWITLYILGGGKREEKTSQLHATATVWDAQISKWTFKILTVTSCANRLNIHKFYVLPHTVYLCVSFGSENKQRLFICTALTNWLSGSFAKLLKATIRFVLSVRLSSRNNSASTRRIFMKFDIWVFFEKSVKKNVTRLTVTLHEDLSTFLVTSRSIFLEWETFQTKVVQKIKTHILCSIIWPASWSSGQSFWLLITRSRVRFPGLPWEFSP